MRLVRWDEALRAGFGSIGVAVVRRVRARMRKVGLGILRCISWTLLQDPKNSVESKVSNGWFVEEGMLLKEKIKNVITSRRTNDPRYEKN